MINLALNELQTDLVASIRDVAESAFPIEDAIRGSKEGTEGVSTAKWAQLAESGVFSVTIGEDEGGVGLGSPEEFLVFVELGRALVPGPLVGTALAAKLALDAGHESAEGLAGGEIRAGIVVGDRVVDAILGDLAVSVDADGATVSEITGYEAQVPTDKYSLVGKAQLTQLFRVDDPTITLRFRLLVGGYAVGVAEAATDSSVEYAKTREQFGKPIGTFQAVKHRCSEMVIRSYPARIELSLGSVMLDSDFVGGGRREVASGHVMAVDAAWRNAEDNIQNHGGIGFTAEARPGVYLKRALTYRQLAGSLENYVEELLSTPETVAV